MISDDLKNLEDKTFVPVNLEGRHFSQPIRADIFLKLASGTSS
jgi:hypothetical protein